MNIELFMVWHEVMILLYLLYLFDKSVFSQVFTSEILINLSLRILPFICFLVCFLSTSCLVPKNTWSIL